MNIDVLRQETAADHLAVEETVPLMKAGLTREEYTSCILRMYGMVSAWEIGAASCAPDWLKDILAARQRTEMLKRDLEFMGITTLPQATPTLPDMSSVEKLLGTMYVMEGSTLGGQLIARHVEKSLALVPGVGDAYFRGHGERTGAMWKEFSALLATRISDDQTGQVIDSAKKMFQVFGSWMQPSPTTL